MGSISGVKLLEVISNVERVLGIELLVAAQAFEFRRPRRTSSELEELISEYRKEINFIEEDQVLNELIDRSLLFITN